MYMHLVFLKQKGTGEGVSDECMKFSCVKLVSRWYPTNGCRIPPAHMEEQMTRALATASEGMPGNKAAILYGVLAYSTMRELGLRLQCTSSLVCFWPLNQDLVCDSVAIKTDFYVIGV